jgi:hypothetical protein
MSRGSSASENYVPIRTGILDHLVRGDISLYELGVYVLIHLQADYSTGVWRGSAPRILANAPRGAELRDIQRAIKHLEDVGYLRSFRKHGQRGNCPYLIDKFTVRCGALKTHRLNAGKSISLQQLAYEPCVESDAEGAPIQKERRKKQKARERTAAEPTPPADPRFQPFYKLAYEAFRTKHGQPPTWRGKEGANLKSFLAEQTHVTAEEWQRRFANYLGSTDAFICKQGHSLSYFTANFDKFRAGPVLERSESTKSQESGRRNDSPAVRAEPGKYDAVEVHRVANNGKVHVV